MRTRWRRLLFGLSTVLGVAPRGFFIPYRYAQGVRPGGYPALLPLFAAAEPQMAEVATTIEAHAEDLLRIAAGDGPARFDQSWFPRLDAAAAYAMVRRAKPRRIVEIGSGHSTRFLARAVADGGSRPRSPASTRRPAATLARLAVRHVPGAPRRRRSGPSRSSGRRRPVHRFEPHRHAGHRRGPALPRRAAAPPEGVLVHVHDVTLPDAYPQNGAGAATTSSSSSGR
jgi:hypothetical protein